MIRKREACKAIKMTAELVALVETKLRLDWSPEQVSGWLDLEKHITLNHERIYQHIWADKKSD
jgi:IS30 family transposase